MAKPKSKSVKIQIEVQVPEDVIELDVLTAIRSGMRDYNEFRHFYTPGTLRAELVTDKTK